MNEPLDDVIHRYGSDRSGRKETERKGGDGIEINEDMEGESDKEWRESGQGNGGRMEETEISSERDREKENVNDRKK